MSCAKGNIQRTRPQKHQNRTAFKNDLHDTSKKTKFLKSLDISGVCERCKEIIEWKIKYKKYKPLTAPKKCVGCEQKTIKHAYHVLCSKCATEKRVCAKCCKPTEITNNSTAGKEEESKFQTALKSLPERKRRTLLRYLKKQQDGQESSNQNIEELLAGLDEINLDDYNDFSNQDDSDSDLDSDS
ncbi:uncharacterized protein C9orf85 homolog [Danaus plexippus]|uniref:Uncharacterized protein n=1 Tax=Danaus plexippus plexippus TaxID=278856 RepID=A0A212FAL7_DANPL|nr:uncharacterized protein C9orf85 homolog [Danaus plexippus]OWR50784.1 hypothetical protein KGM_208067 [Danaus plexippus plexippus]